MGSSATNFPPRSIRDAKRDSARLPSEVSCKILGPHLAQKLVLAGLQQGGRPPGTRTESAWCPNLQPTRPSQAVSVARKRRLAAGIPLHIPLVELRFAVGV